MLPRKPVPESMRNSHLPLFRDPAVEIRDAFGGPVWFFEKGARAVHRVGLFLGLGWRLPFGECKDYIDQIVVTTEPRTTTYRMEFRRYKQNSDPPESSLIRAVNGVKRDDLLTVYEDNT